MYVIFVKTISVYYQAFTISFYILTFVITAYMYAILIRTISVYYQLFSINFLLNTHCICVRPHHTVELLTTIHKPVFKSGILTKALLCQRLSHLFKQPLLLQVTDISIGKEKQREMPYNKGDQDNGFLNIPNQAPVAQSVDNFIQRIKCVSWSTVYPLDNVIRSFNNWAQGAILKVIHVKREVSRKF